jgi:hypothetical protein
LESYGKITWVLKKKNPVGWLCAQPGFMAGFVKAIQENYYLHGQNTNGPKNAGTTTTTTRMAFPDYLLLVDDDTIINISQLWNTELQFHNRDVGMKYVATGCRVRDVDLYSAFGGFGTLFSRGTLEHLTTPIVCNTTTTGQQQKGPYMERTTVCKRIEENLLGERPFFHDGMTLVELFGARVAAQKYSEFASWDIEFCFHSDQYFAAFVEIYCHGTNSWKRPGVRKCRTIVDFGTRQAIVPTMTSAIYKRPFLVTIRPLHKCTNGNENNNNQAGPVDST